MSNWKEEKAARMRELLKQPERGTMGDVELALLGADALEEIDRLNTRINLEWGDGYDTGKADALAEFAGVRRKAR